MLRVRRGLEGFEGRSSLRAWLYKIATNTCLDAIARKKRLLPEEYGPKADPNPPGGARRRAGLDRVLPRRSAGGRGRLRLPSVNSALQHARKIVDERLPDHSQQVTLRSLGDAR